MAAQRKQDMICKLQLENAHKNGYLNVRDVVFEWTLFLIYLFKMHALGTLDVISAYVRQWLIDIIWCQTCINPGLSYFLVHSTNAVKWPCTIKCKNSVLSRFDVTVLECIRCDLVSLT